MNTSLRSKIKSIDSQFFNGRLKKLNRILLQYQSYFTQKPLIKYWLQKPYTKKIINNFTSKIEINFNQEKQNCLGDLFDKYGSARCHCPSIKDECIATGCYHHIYDVLFSLHRDKVKILLECGIGSKKTSIPYNMSTLQSTPGGGLRAWRDYFPNAQIIGLDIDLDVMFTENRINTFECDQTSKTSIDKFITQANLQPNTIDIIIDDGMHEFKANITLFENIKYLLKDNGIYVIEDFFIKNKEQQLFIDYFSNLTGYYVRLFKFTARYLIVITKQN